MSNTTTLTCLNVYDFSEVTSTRAQTQRKENGKFIPS